MLYLVHFKEIRTLVHFKYEIPQIASSDQAEMEDFIVKQSMHVKPVNGDVTETSYCLIKHVNILSFAVDTNFLRIPEIASDGQPILFELKQQIPSN